MHKNVGVQIYTMFVIDFERRLFKYKNSHMNMNIDLYAKENSTLRGIDLF